MKVLLMSRYGRLGASSRLRSYQFLPLLAALGVDVDPSALFDDDYVAALYRGERPLPLVARGFARRIAALARARAYDACWIEKELLPWLPAWLEHALLPLDLPVIVDYDDAIFHQYDHHRSRLVRRVLGHKIDAVMRRAALVVAGNEYLAARARAAGAPRVEVVPTVVDVARYAEPVPAPAARDGCTIGWIGNPGTARYLARIAPALEAIARRAGVRLVAIGANASQVAGLPIEAVPWSEATEVAELQAIDIGIMPLPDEPFERGKCGYKLIQYMACGRPVVASPVGVNAAIVRDGVNGFLAGDDAQWLAALTALVDDPARRARMGAAGRADACARFSLAAAAPRIAGLMHSVRTMPCAA